MPGNPAEVVAPGIHPAPGHIPMPGIAPAPLNAAGWNAANASRNGRNQTSKPESCAPLAVNICCLRCGFAHSMPRNAYRRRQVTFMSESPIPMPTGRDPLPRRTTPTWEMELLISGATVFSLMQAPDLLDRLYYGFAPRLEAAYQAALILPRSEEHTSELQSRENLVCRLLL